MPSFDEILSIATKINPSLRVSTTIFYTAIDTNSGTKTKDSKMTTNFPPLDYNPLTTEAQRFQDKLLGDAELHAEYHGRSGYNIDRVHWM